MGLGPIGQGIARLVLETEGLQLIGATDPSPDLAGKNLGAVLGLTKRLRLKVDGNPERFVRKARADPPGPRPRPPTVFVRGSSR